MNENVRKFIDRLKSFKLAEYVIPIGLTWSGITVLGICLQVALFEWLALIAAWLIIIGAVVLGVIVLMVALSPSLDYIEVLDYEDLLRALAEPPKLPEFKVVNFIFVMAMLLINGYTVTGLGLFLALDSVIIMQRYARKWVTENLVEVEEEKNTPAE